jgi:hypothetical protein
MKAIVWYCLAVLSVGFGLTMVFFYPFKHPLHQELGRTAVFVEPVMAIQPFCALWMVYQARRHESNPLYYLLLAAFVPFAFVWYYFERFRPRKRLGRPTA